MGDIVKFQSPDPQSAADAMSSICVRCYVRALRGERAGVGEIQTIYGAYCHPCYERERDSITEATQRVRASRMAYLRRLSEIGERFEDRSFANYRVSEANRHAYEAAQETWEDRGGMYVHGRAGNGKSHLAAAIVNAAMEGGIEAIFVTGIGLLQRIRESYKRNQTESERGVIGHYAGVPVLVLDDLGTEPFTADTGRLFYALINRRYEGRHKLIVTSNLSLSDLAIQWRKSGVEPHVGDKIVDRIREMCDNRIVRLDAPSERGAA